MFTLDGQFHFELWSFSLDIWTLFFTLFFKTNEILKQFEMKWLHSQAVGFH